MGLGRLVNEAHIPTDRAARSLAYQSKSEKCEIAETQLRQRARLQLGQSTGYRPRPDPSQMAFRTCKEATSDIWRWPVLRRKMATRSRRRTTTSTPNVTTDRCSPKKVKYFPPRVDVDPWLDTMGSALQIQSSHFRCSSNFGHITALRQLSQGADFVEKLVG